MLAKNRKRPAIERFLEKIFKQENGCWIWTATKHYHGYGVLVVERKNRKAHRFSYEHFIGPIPKGLEIDHLCKNKSCVNPEHLEPVTHAENMRRADCSMAGQHFAIKQMTKTHCPKGHAYSGDNLDLKINPRGKQTRICKTCRIEYGRFYREDKRLEKILESGIW